MARTEIYVPELWFKKIAMQNESAVWLDKDNSLDILKAMTFDMYDFSIVDVHVEESDSKESQKNDQDESQADNKKQGEKGKVTSIYIKPKPRCLILATQKVCFLFYIGQTVSRIMKSR